MPKGSAARSKLMGVVWMYWKLMGTPVTAAVVLNVVNWEMGAGEEPGGAQLEEERQVSRGGQRRLDS